jgi:hypothetical protein
MRLRISSPTSHTHRATASAIWIGRVSTKIGRCGFRCTYDRAHSAAHALQARDHTAPETTPPECRRHHPRHARSRYSVAEWVATLRPEQFRGAAADVDHRLRHILGQPVHRHASVRLSHNPNCFGSTSCVATCAASAASPEPGGPARPAAARSARPHRRCVASEPVSQ